MITKQQFIESFETELNIIRHLGTKVTPEMLDYRPHPKQRSMLELMNYLGHIFATGAEIIVVGTSVNYMELTAKAPQVTLENFDSVMAAQAVTVREKLEGFSEDRMKKEIEIFGRKDTTAMHLMGVMKWSVAYKMQLFLYIKACGNHDIATSNLWRGTDPAPKE